MIFHPVLVILLCWQCVGGKEIDNISIESVLDQVAIPTRIIDEFLQKPGKTKKFASEEQIESSTVHYENSNGFVPLIVSTQPYELKQKRRNFTRHASNTLNGENANIPKAAEDDPMFSTEARILINLSNPSQNRRSFNTDDNGDEFELLKVSNGTPAVANYDLFYNHAKENSETNFKKSLRSKNRDRGKRIQSYLGMYDATHDDNGEYSQGSDNKEQKKNYYQENTHNNNYKQDNTGNHRTQKSSLPRTNYAALSTTKSSVKIHNSNGEKIEDHRFKSPIMVEPSDYKVDVRFNGQTIQSVVSTSSPQNDIKDQQDSVNIDLGNFEQSPQTEGNSRNYESADSRDFSEENPDYMDEMEKSRRVHKTSSKRRPYYYDSSRKLPKEHREVYEDSYDDQGRKRPSMRSKSRHRQKPKPIPIVNPDEQYDNEGDNLEDNVNNSNNQENFDEGATWNQVAPNVEVSHSNGFEINQIEKPKLHIVPVNILSNFDHATALDNSQGFDITNAMFTGFHVHDGVVSTASPLLSSTPNSIDQNLILSSTVKPQFAMSTSVPDVIVGQSSFHNPVQVLMPNKLQQNMLNQYMQSTVSPAIFAVTPSPGYSASTTIAPSLQQMLSQVQSNRQTLTNYFQPAQTSSNNKLYVNNNGLQGSNPYQYQSSQSTTSRPNSDRGESPYKKRFNGNNGQFLASASLSVGQGGHRHSNNKDNNNKQNNNNDDTYSSQNNQHQQVTKQNLNAFVQPTVVPAILHTGIGIINNQNPLVQNAFDSSMRQLQYDIQNNRYQFTGLSGVDNSGAASNNVNAINNLITPVQKAHLPILGAKNVEIINPNLNANAYAINQIPATLVTTPFPIFTTTAFFTPKQSYSSTTQEPPGQDRPMYNPINFVPNYDLVKSQSILNSNVVPNDPFSQQNLNLVPIIPGGNFYKHSPGAQVDLVNKPKLNSDLEKYAEEMFRESLRTIYNTHKWNNDPRSPGNISLVDNSDLAKLRNELIRIKNNIRDSKVPKDVLEAHYTENKIRTAKPGSDYKRPDSSIEQPYKHEHKPHSGKGPHHHSHPHRHKPAINDFLTPPRFNSFISKSPFHDKPPPKRRPGPGHGPGGHGPRPSFNYENSRPRPRQGVAHSKPKGPEPQASAIVDYNFPVRSHPENLHHNQLDPRGSQSFNYPSFTTSYPENDVHKSSTEYRSSEREFYDINHQRTHNLMGLLMKNNKLPPGTQGGNYYSDQDTVGQYFDEENRRLQSQAYADALRSFQKKSDRYSQLIPMSRISSRVYSKANPKQ